MLATFLCGSCRVAAVVQCGAGSLWWWPGNFGALAAIGGGSFQGESYVRFQAIDSGEIFKCRILLLAVMSRRYHPSCCDDGVCNRFLFRRCSNEDLMLPDISR